MRECSDCGKVLPLTTEYFKRDRRRSHGWTHRCLLCLQSLAEYRQRPKTSPDITKARATKAFTDRRLIENRAKMLTLLSLSPCTDCGNSDVRVLEFDHVRGEKSFNIGYALARRYRWVDILEEIKKCDVVCANCHRIRTVERSGNYRPSGLSTPE